MKNSVPENCPATTDTAVGLDMCTDRPQRETRDVRFRYGPTGSDVGAGGIRRVAAAHLWPHAAVSSRTLDVKGPAYV